jgi:aspartate/methionine/tyrosine aminotransferase
VAVRAVCISVEWYTFVDMRLEPFAMERWQSVWEHRVAWNVSESGVEPLRLEELADTEEDRTALLAQELAYTQTNGTADLRAAIAAMYPGATAEHIEVTNGGSEANCIAIWHLLGPGDQMVMMTPNYMQVGGLARGVGADVREWPLVHGPEQDIRWQPDIDRLRTLVTERTKVIAICNPNNPTGARFSETELDAICAIADRVGAWVLSDEIYRGAEREADETPTIWGRSERAIVTSGLSKAYGLPGLRIGWVVGPPHLVETLWGVHDYTTIAPGALNDRLARMAFDRRERLLARTRGIIRSNYAVVRRWIDQRPETLSHVPPEAGAIVFVRYSYAINSTKLVERLRDEQSVLVVPGDHFEMDGYLRLGFGSHPALLTGALSRIGELLDTLPAGDAR